MFDYFMEKLKQLADTLLEPVWHHVLAWPWLARALVLLIGSGIAYVVFSPGPAKSAWSLTSSVIRVVWADESRIPISESVIEKMKEAISRLSSTLEADLDLPN